MSHVIFVLGHANDASGKLSDISVGRIQRAASLWESLKQATKPVIVLTGGFADRFNTTERPHWQHAMDALLALGVPQSSIFESGLESQHTVEDAALIVEYVRTAPSSRRTIVTSESHLARCRLIFACLAPEQNFEFAGVSEADNAIRSRHESDAIARLQHQGGVVWAGELFPIPEGFEL